MPTPDQYYGPDVGDAAAAMEFEVSYTLDDEQQFWDGMSSRVLYVFIQTECALELDDILSVRCNSPELIDQTLRSFLRFTSTYRGPLPPSSTA